MQRPFRSILCTAILFATTASTVGAQVLRINLGGDTTSILTPAQRAFNDRYLAAVTGPDIERYKALLHPGTRACMSAANADYFEVIFKRRVNNVATSPKVSVETLPDSVSLLKAFEAHGYLYPIRPTHAFYMDLVSTGPKQSSIAAFAVLDKNTWYEVIPCPTPKALDLMRKSKARDDSVSARARTLLGDLRDPLRAELLALLKQDLSVSAKKKYAEVAKVDMTTAVRVVDGLKELGR